MEARWGDLERALDLATRSKNAARRSGNEWRDVGGGSRRNAKVRVSKAPQGYRPKLLVRADISVVPHLEEAMAVPPLWHRDEPRDEMSRLLSAPLSDGHA